VDELGNLYFTTSDSEINMISFVDLWKGSQNAHVTVFGAATGKLDTPLGIDICDGDELWWINNKNAATVGSLNTADADTKANSDEDIDTYVDSREGVVDVTVDDDNAYFLTANEVFHFDMDDDTNEITTLFSGTTLGSSISYAEDMLFVADHATGNVFKISAEDVTDAGVEAWVVVEGAHGVHCVNHEDTAVMAVFAGLLFLLLS
jgi:hypothetical protein